MTHCASLVPCSIVFSIIYREPYVRERLSYANFYENFGEIKIQEGLCTKCLLIMHQHMKIKKELNIGEWQSFTPVYSQKQSFCSVTTACPMLMGRILFLSNKQLSKSL